MREEAAHAEQPNARWRAGEQALLLPSARGTNVIATTTGAADTQPLGFRAAFAHSKNKVLSCSLKGTSGLPRIKVNWRCVPCVAHSATYGHLHLKSVCSVGTFLCTLLLKQCVGVPSED